MVAKRFLPAVGSVASILLFATCDFDKISGTPKPITAADLAKVFSISPASDSLVTLGGSVTLSIVPGAGIDLTNTTTRWRSSDANLARIDTLTGVVTGVGVGSSIITARVMSPELDTGYAQTRSMRVRYKAIKAAALDSIPGKNMALPVIVNGTNLTNALVTPAIPQPTLSVHDSGSANSTVAAVSGNAVFGRSNGLAYVVALFDGFRDSTKVKVRQVAKTLGFPTVEYTATALNHNRTLPLVIKDVNDSTMLASPVMRWRASDTSVVSIDSLSGVFRVKKRDTARIYVRVDTIQKDQKLLVQQAVASLQIDAGTNQTDTVGRLLAIAPQVTALDSGGTAVPGRTITFRLGAGGKDAGAVITDSVKLTDAQGRATLGSWRLGPRAQIQTVRAVFGADTTALFTATAVPGRPFGLRFSEQPTNAGENASLGSVKVSVVDSLENLIATASHAITIGLGNNPPGGALNGTKTVTAVNGVATFTNLSLTEIGRGYTLSASATGLAGVVSNAVDVFGAPTKLGFLTQPTDVTLNASIAPSIRVAVQDANGVTVTTATPNVSLSFANNPGSSTLAGTVTQAAVGGVATFNNIALNQVANSYRLAAGSQNLAGATSNNFNVRPVGTPARLAFVQHPGSHTSGSTMCCVTVEIRDANNSRVTTSTLSITLAIESNPGGGTLSGGTTVAAQSGLATFSALGVNKVGAGYTLRATCSSCGTVSAAVSNSFGVTAGSATKIGFIVQPTHTNPAAAIDPPVQVAFMDDADNIVANTAPRNIVLTVSGSTLQGTTTKAHVAGVSVFDNLVVPTLGNAFFLTATVTGGPGPSATGSAPFNVVAASGGARKLRWVSTPSTAVAGTSMSNVFAEIIDANGARVPSATNAITVSPSGPSTSITGIQTIGANSGLAQWGNLALQKAGTYKLVASATGFPSVSSNDIVVSATTPQVLAFLTQPPATATASAALTPSVQVAVHDQFGNVVTTQTSNIGLSIAEGPAGATLSGTTLRQAVAGIATFDNISTATSGSGFKLRATTNAGFTQALSDFFDVVAGTPTQLAFKVQPLGGVANNVMPAVDVEIRDANGNVVVGASTPITLALSGGTPGAVLGGTKTVTPTNGVASFNDLAVDKIGSGYKLSASGSGFPTVTSNQFGATFGPASKLAWSIQPTNRAGGQTFSVNVMVQDANGNLVATDGRTISLSIVGGTGTPGATLSGVTSKPAGGGEAVFDDISVDKVGGGYKLFAGASGVTGLESDPFDVSLGPKAKLTFKDQPPAQTNGGENFATSVSVWVTDLGGNLVNSTGDLITLSLDPANSPAGAVLSGTATIAASGGIATFGGLSINKSSNGYRLNAATPSLGGGQSDAFNVAVGPKAKVTLLNVNTNPTSLVNFAVLVAITDLGGNTVNTADHIVVTKESGPGILSGTLSGNANGGVLDFTELKLDLVGIYTLRFSSGSLAHAITQNIDVDPGAQAKLAWLSQPQPTYFNAPLNPSGPQPQIELQDAAGNRVNDGQVIRIELVSPPGGTSLHSNGANCTPGTGGSVAVCQFDAVAGLLTVPSTVTINGTSGVMTLRATTPNNPSVAFANSDPFALNEFSSASKVSFIQQPTDVGHGIHFSPTVTVAVQDQWGNTVTNATDQIGVGISSNPGGATLTGLNQVNAASGVASFPTLSLDKAGAGYSLSANANSMIGTVSQTFSVASIGEVTTFNTQLDDLVRLGDTIFYVRSGEVKKVAATGGTPVLVHSGNAERTIASDGVSVYWGDVGDGVIRKYTPGSGVSTVIGGLTGLSDQPRSLQTDGLNVYFIAQNATNSALAIRSVPVAGGSATDLYSTDNLGQFPDYGLAGGFIYFNAATADEIRRMSSGGGAATTLANVAGIRHFAMIGATLYVAQEWEGGSIYSIPSAESYVGAPITPTAVTTMGAQQRTFALASVGGLLYAHVEGTLRRYNPADFSSFTTLGTASSLYGWYQRLTFDDRSIYYKHGDGRILKTAK